MMKRLLLTALFVLMSGMALAPTASARQLSVTSELGPEASLVDLVRYNREARGSR